MASPASETSCSAWPLDSAPSPPLGPPDTPTSGSASSVFSTVPPASLVRLEQRDGRERCASRRDAR
eukprot:2326750-Pleurochrysis_carterae.AAC.1